MPLLLGKVPLTIGFVLLPGSWGILEGCWPGACVVDKTGLLLEEAGAGAGVWAGANKIG